MSADHSTGKRKLSAAQIVNDLRSGMTNDQIAEKYRISPGKLQTVFRRLLAAGSIETDELEGRLFATNSEGSPEENRILPRHHIVFHLPVYDLDDISGEGYVKDISERGLQTIGIVVEKGQSKSLLIQADGLADVYPFNFDAVCRWIGPSDSADDLQAGFEISAITDGGMDELRKLIRLLAFGDSSND